MLAELAKGQRWGPQGNRPAVPPGVGALPGTAWKDPEPFLASEGLSFLGAKSASLGGMLISSPGLNMRKNFFPLKVTEPWPRLPREAVESLSLEIFKTCLDKVLYRLL